MAHAVNACMRKYPKIKNPSREGLIYAHRWIAERALGRPLKVTEHVHHHSDTQLVICQDRAYHALLERRTRALRGCGDVNGRKCWICKKYDRLENLRRMKSGGAHYHVVCVGRYNRKLEREKKIANKVGITDSTISG